MANPQHIEWLLQGVKAWNARRDQTDFKPDFEDANISESFRKAGKLAKDGYVPLVGINLKNANLHKARQTAPRYHCRTRTLCRSAKYASTAAVGFVLVPTIVPIFRAARLCMQCLTA